MLLGVQSSTSEAPPGQQVTQIKEDTFFPAISERPNMGFSAPSQPSWESRKLLSRLETYELIPDMVSLLKTFI